MTILALLVPALPIASAEAELSADPSLQTTQSISRLETLLLAAPTLFDLPSLWSGQPPTTPETSQQPIGNPIGQRLSAVAFAALWILVTYSLGSLLVGSAQAASRRNPLHSINQLSPNNPYPLCNTITSVSKRVVIGHCIALLLIALHARLTSSQSLAAIPLLALALPCVLLLIWVNHRFLKCIHPLSTNDPSAHHFLNVSSDPTWQHRWSRRIVGVSFLACLTLCSLPLLGSTLPTYDIDIRQDDWIAIQSRLFPAQNTIHLHNAIDPQLISISPASPLPSFPLPSSRSLPALGIAHTLQTIGYFSSDTTHTLPLLNVLMIGQAIDAWMFSIAIALAISWTYQSQGLLAGWITGVLLASHPGVHELVRLGLGAGLACLVLLLALLWLEEQSQASSKGTKLNLVTQREQLFTAAAVLILATWSSFPTLWIATLPILLTWAQYLRCPSINNSMTSSTTAGMKRYSPWVASTIRFCVPCTCAAWIFWQWTCGTWGEPLSSITAPKLTLSSIGNTFARMMMLSPSNQWLLIPLALAGGILANKTNLPKNSLVCIKLGLCFVALSWTLWFAIGAQLERQWVIATVALLPAAAAAIRIFQQNLGAWFCIPLCWTLLAWACIAIPTWPYCDQRLLAPLQSYAPHFLHPNDASETSSTPLAPWYTDWVDAQSQATPDNQTNERWWLIGTSDVFFWRVPTCVHSWKTPSLSLPEFSLLKHHRVGYILVDYDGIEAHNLRLKTSFPGTPKYQPEAIRGQLEKWVQQGLLQRCDPWGDSQHAACYQVIASDSP